MKPGIYLENKFLTSLTAKDFERYSDINELLKIKNIKDEGLTVVLPKSCSESFAWNFFNRYAEDFTHKYRHIKTVHAENLTDLPFSFGEADLEEIYLPDNLSKDSEKVATFLSDLSYAENLKTIHISEKNKDYCTENGILYNKDKSKLIIYPGKNTSEINKNVKTINGLAFISLDTTRLIIPYGVTKLCRNSLLIHNAYSMYQKPVSIFLPDTIETIEPRFVWKEKVTIYCSNKVKEKINEYYHDIIKELTVENMVSAGCTKQEIDKIFIPKEKKVNKDNKEK